MANITTVQARQINRLTNDIATDTQKNARFIGNIKPGDSRVTLISQLSGKDKDTVDNFKFTMTKAGTIGLSSKSAPNVRIELLDKQGTVLADSGAADKSALKTAYDTLQSSKTSLDKGDYYLRVSRMPKSDATQSLSYNLQISAGSTGGKYKEDYTTVEVGKTATSAAQKANKAANAVSILNASPTNAAGNGSSSLVNFLV
jgi:hypothetical protein